MRRRRLSTMKDPVSVQPRCIEMGAVAGHVVGGHVISAHVIVGSAVVGAGARVGDAHLDAVVPLQSEQTAHHDGHVSSVWPGDAGDVQLAVGRRRVTSVPRLIPSARRGRPRHGRASICLPRYEHKTRPTFCLHVCC